MQVKGELEYGKFLMQSHPLTNSETQRYNQNEPQFNVVYSSDKNGAYIICVDGINEVGTQ